MTISLPENTTCMDLFIAQEVRAGKLDPKCALDIENVHLRVETINEVDGWDAVLNDCELIEKTGRGELYSAEWLKTRLLKVVCPSTGSQYVLGVPSEVNSVDEAQRFINRGAEKFGDMES